MDHRQIYALSKRGLLSSQRFRMNEAEQSYSHALNASTQMYGSNHIMTALCLHQLAEFLFNKALTVSVCALSELADMLQRSQYLYYCALEIYELDTKYIKNVSLTLIALADLLNIQRKLMEYEQNIEELRKKREAYTEAIQVAELSRFELLRLGDQKLGK